MPASAPGRVRGLSAMGLLIAALTALAAPALRAQDGPSVDATRQEIQAAHWFNNPPPRLNDDRTVVLLFFDDRELASREEPRWVHTLNRASLRRDMLVIGLTTASRRDTEDFIRRSGVRFPIGAGSRSARDFGVKRFPAVIIIDRREKSAARPVTIDELEHSLPPPDTAASEARLAELRRLLESDLDSTARSTAVRSLFQSLDRAVFVALVDQQLEVERDPWVRGNLRFHRDIALGADRDDDRFTPSATAAREFLRQGDDARWAPVREFQLGRGSRASADGIYGAYLARSGNEPADVLIRRMATEELWKSDDRQTARRHLIDIVQADPDASIRMIAAMALGDVCAVGDVEVAGLLDALAEIEPNVLRTRPMLEYVAYYLRTGQEEVALMEPRP